VPPKVKKKAKEKAKTPEAMPEVEALKPKTIAREDEFGNLYLEEVDFLKWANKRLRANACRHQAEALRNKAEVVEMKMQMEIKRLRNSAAAFEKAGKVHESSYQDQLTALSKKYNLDFKNPNITLDDEDGRIGLMDPEKGFPWLKE